MTSVRPDAGAGLKDVRRQQAVRDDPREQTGRSARRVRKELAETEAGEKTFCYSNFP
jgi:hypothetical protein